MIKKIGIIGLGTVGEATIRSLKKYSSLIARRSGLKIKIKAVCDVKKKKQRLARRFGLSFSSRPEALLNDPEIDTIVELVGGVEGARRLIIAALKKGKNVVTANKALLASQGREIFALAQKKRKAVGFEASVCGAIPLIKSVSQGLAACQIKKIYGILNGTTNYILYKMGQEKIDFSSALKQAKRGGLAEKRPRLDIEGIDTLHKLCILSYICFGVWPSLRKVYTEGISRISLLDVLYAEELNYRIKLLAIAKKEKDGLELRVHPTLVPLGHPLSEVASSFNAVYLDSQPAGPLFFYGQGAGGAPTSSAVLSDIVNISLGGKEFLRAKSAAALFKNIREIKTRYYIRFMAKDQPGVLAKISKILADLKISIASVKQKERNKGRLVPIVMLTHEAAEDSISRALAKIDRLSVIKKPSQAIRIEDL